MRTFIRLARSIVRRSSDGFRSEERFKFYDQGFHGDRNLLRVVDMLMQRVEVFVETGANVGSTLAYVAKRYPRVACYSCEPDLEAHALAREHTKALDNVVLAQQSSGRFLDELSAKRVLDRSGLYWLDAHGYGFEWPLRDEIALLTAEVDHGCLLVDDFKVPGRPDFGFDEYDGQVCSFDYVASAISSEAQVRLFYPEYRNPESPHHNARGWGLFVLGNTFDDDIRTLVSEGTLAESDVQLGAL